MLIFYTFCRIRCHKRIFFTYPCSKSFKIDVVANINKQYFRLPNTIWESGWLGVQENREMQKNWARKNGNPIFHLLMLNSCMNALNMMLIRWMMRVTTFIRQNKHNIRYISDPMLLIFSLLATLRPLLLVLITLSLRRQLYLTFQLI